MDSDYPGIITDVVSNRTTNFIGIVSYTILIWDHIITFSDEVELIWKSQKRGTIIYLFFVIRYLVPLAFIVNLFAYFSPSWTVEMCNQFVRYEGVLHVAEIFTVAYMMMLRVNALYGGVKWIGWCLTGYIIVEIGVMSYILIHGKAVLHNPSSGVAACTMIFSDELPSAASSTFAWLPLMYDTIVLGLTLYRTVPAVAHNRAGRLLNCIFQDGLLYFIVIFALALSLTFMMIFASNEGIKNVMAQMTQLLTVVMMCRITLHLKRLGSQPQAYEVSSKGVRALEMGPSRRRNINTEHVSTLKWQPNIPQNFQDTFGLATVVENQLLHPPSPALHASSQGQIETGSPTLLQPISHDSQHQDVIHNTHYASGDLSFRPSTSMSTQYHA